MFLLLQTGIKKQHELAFDSASSKIRIFTVLDHENKNWQWIDKNEFRYEGVMYDVKRKEILEDGTRYYCKIDHKEMSLFKGLGQFIKSISDTQGTDHKESKSHIKEFFKDYFPVNNKDLVSQQGRKTCSLYIKDQYLSVITDLQSPPPKFS